MAFEISRRTALGALMASSLTACRSKAWTSDPIADASSISAGNNHMDGITLSTWNHGRTANRAGVRVLNGGGTALDAVESGCRAVELDCPDMTVGLASRPDRDGFVTLDAAIMTGEGRAGAVGFVRGVVHPISLARAVMERTPHVLLVGAGAEQFARESGLEVRPECQGCDAEGGACLSPAAEREWREWLLERQYRPRINIENHDTISMLALDKNGRMAAGSTTSGLAYKMHGRVGDSPIIGAGIFVDAPIGGAICTGLGETVLRTLGAHLAVEAMRHGMTPQEACEHAIARIIEKNGNPAEYQVGMLALDFRGRVGAFAVQKGFTYALGESLHDAPSELR